MIRNTMLGLSLFALMTGSALAATPVSKHASKPRTVAAAPAAGGINSHFYVTYWEGHCKPFFGCGRGDTKVQRCTVMPDNNVKCAEETNATKALTPD